MVIAVGYYYYEQFAEKFHIPLKKMRLLYNYVENAIYSTEKTEDAKHSIGMVGILPSRKGLRRGLELLKLLKETDPRFRLRIMGNRPEEVSWIKNNPAEKEYFDSCESYIRENGLNDAVIYGGYRDRSELYSEIGYVLSLSDPDFPESFHLSPAEGACAGSMGLLLRWPGVEYLYSDDAVFDTLEDMAAHILRAASDDGFFAESSDALRDYVLKNYGIDCFLECLDRYLRQLFLIS